MLKQLGSILSHKKNIHKCQHSISPIHIDRDKIKQFQYNNNTLKMSLLQGLN